MLGAVRASKAKPTVVLALASAALLARGAPAASWPDAATSRTPPATMRRLPTSGCVERTAAQRFSGGGHAMVGCSGSVAWVNASSLCARGWHVCTSGEFASRVGRTPPTHHYWVRDYLRGSGSISACIASTSTSNTNFCPEDAPMRVCSVDSVNDGVNYCTWNKCSLESTDQPPYFGGCNAAPAGQVNNAGALCCL
jgi:hypothetical protein